MKTNDKAEVDFMRLEMSQSFLGISISTLLCMSEEKTILKVC